jgi:Gluconate 2-dehydrogenase subunit 3
MNPTLPRLSRRDVLRFFSTATALCAVPQVAAAGPAGSPVPQGAAGGGVAAKGYGTDPNLMKEYQPGDLWPLTFTADQRKTAAALADAILPADDLGPSASSLRVPDYIDEWISAPYAAQQESRGPILDGLAWLEAESQKRFNKGAADAPPAGLNAILADICDVAAAKPAFKDAARFFVAFRGLASGAYYATPAGWKAIGYVGNVPLLTFDGPPPEVLAKLGLEQTVK